MSDLPYVFGSTPVKDSTQLNANFDAIESQLGAIKGIKNIYYTSDDSEEITADEAYHTVLSLTVNPATALYHLVIAKYYKCVYESSGSSSLYTEGTLITGATTLDKDFCEVILAAGGMSTLIVPINLMWYGQLSAGEHIINLQDKGFSGFEANTVSYAKLFIVQFDF